MLMTFGVMYNIRLLLEEVISWAQNLSVECVALLTAGQVYSMSSWDMRH